MSETVEQLELPRPTVAAAEKRVRGRVAKRAATTTKRDPDELEKEAEIEAEIEAITASSAEKETEKEAGERTAEKKEGAGEDDEQQFIDPAGQWSYDKG